MLGLRGASAAVPQAQVVHRPRTQAIREKLMAKRLRPTAIEGPVTPPIVAGRFPGYSLFRIVATVRSRSQAVATEVPLLRVGPQREEPTLRVRPRRPGCGLPVYRYVAPGRVGVWFSGRSGRREKRFREIANPFTPGFSGGAVGSPKVGAHPGREPAGRDGPFAGLALD